LEILFDGSDIKWRLMKSPASHEQKITEEISLISKCLLTVGIGWKPNKVPDILPEKRPQISHMCLLQSFEDL